VKYTTETRTRTVPKVIDGKPHDVEEKFTVEVPVPPADRDAQAIAAVTALAVLIVTGALVWSTVSIGSLLSMVAPTWTAFMIAAVFDLAWIGCLTLEWVNRYDPQKAAQPRKAGWMALGISMGLITAHGAVQGHVWVGLAGAAVALVAKGFWHLVMRTTGAELDDATQQWVDAERREVGAQLATVTVKRQLARTKAKAADELSALESGSGSVRGISWSTDDSGGLTQDRLHDELARSVRPDPDRQSAGSGSIRIPDQGGSGSVKDRVRTLMESGTTDPAAVVEALPGANPETVRRMVRLMKTEGGYA
jgi:hypothetical protein